MSNTDPSVLKELEKYTLTELTNELDARQRKK
jgi:hypothetical protein